MINSKFLLVFILAFVGGSDCLSATTASSVHQPTNISYWIPIQASGEPLTGGNIGKWHLVRTPGPDKSGDIVSIMHTADALQSDPDFAGMMIRCQPRAALQIAFILITPFPPRSRPQVTVSVNHNGVRFQGEPIPPGSMIALPREAEVLAKGPWRSGSELAVDIENGANPIHGIIPLDNLADAISYLQANCSDH
jgi:hypothetical protein